MERQSAVWFVWHYMTPTESFAKPETPKPPRLNLKLQSWGEKNGTYFLTHFYFVQQLKRWWILKKVRETPFLSLSFGGSLVWVKRYNLHYFSVVDHLNTWLQIHILMGKTEQWKWRDHTSFPFSPCLCSTFLYNFFIQYKCKHINVWEEAQVKSVADWPWRITVEIPAMICNATVVKTHK